jgi:hypothetical protein
MPLKVSHVTIHGHLTLHCQALPWEGSHHENRGNGLKIVTSSTAQKQAAAKTLYHKPRHSQLVFRLECYYRAC